MDTTRDEALETDKERADRLQAVIDGVAMHITYDNTLKTHARFELEYSQKVFALDTVNRSPMYNALAKLFQARSRRMQP